jgi:hypothetical protein
MFVENQGRSRPLQSGTPNDNTRMCQERKGIEDGLSESCLDYTSPPGIDRISSAWLIKRFIDSKATFLFGNDPASHPEAVPFDMCQSSGFGHEGEKCTFETLCLHFDIPAKKPN